MGEKEPFNVLVTGSRDYKRMELVEQVLYGIIEHGVKGVFGDLFVGDARGVDKEAMRVWRKYAKKEPKKFEANWDKYGKAAGPIRNAEMVKAYDNAGRGIFLAFWDGKSRGTRHCMEEGRKRNMLVLLPAGFKDHDPVANTASLALEPWQGIDPIIPENN